MGIVLRNMGSAMSIFLSVRIERDLRAFVGLPVGVRADNSASDEASVEFGYNFWAFLCLRAFFLFNPALRSITSLLYSVAGISSGSMMTGFKATGLATCARVAAFDISK